MGIRWVNLPSICRIGGPVTEAPHVIPILPCLWFVFWDSGSETTSVAPLLSVFSVTGTCSLLSQDCPSPLPWINGPLPTSMGNWKCLRLCPSNYWPTTGSWSLTWGETSQRHNLPSKVPCSTSLRLSEIPSLPLPVFPPSHAVLIPLPVP